MIDAKAFKWHRCTVQKLHSVLADLIDLCRQGFIFSLIIIRFKLCLFFCKVVTDLSIDRIDLPDVSFQFGCGFHFQFFRSVLCFLCFFGKILFSCIQISQSSLEAVDLIFRLIQCHEDAIIFSLPLLTHSVPGENLLLLRNHFRCGDQILRHSVPLRKLIGMTLLFLGNSSDRQSFIGELVFLSIELGKLIADTDDIEESSCLFLFIGIHELRQIESELADKAVQQCLARLCAGRISHLQGAVLAGSLDNDSVAENDLHVRIDHGSISFYVRRLVISPAQRVSDCIQDTGFALIVSATDHCQSGSSGFDFDSLDPLHILKLKTVDLYCVVCHCFPLFLLISVFK